MKKILIIQTAFIGDVILATPIIEKLNAFFPNAEIDFLLRKGNEGLLENHPHLRKVLIWDKKSGKYKNLIKITCEARREKYDLLINLQRFASSGYISLFSGAGIKAGFDKNPLSFAFNHKVKHEIGNGEHETERNLGLIAKFTDCTFVRPRLYPSDEDYKKASDYSNQKFITISPASVWFTKQFPKEKWIEFINKLESSIAVYLLGSPADYELNETIISGSSGKNVINLAGKLSLLQSAALMKWAIMNYTNDSAPLHLASAMNAPVKAVFCSTVPDFGFGPVSDNSEIIQTEEKLSCRPCGLHGKKECPQKHFKCGFEINVEKMLP